MSLNIQQHLLTGERLSWKGSPIPGFTFRAMDTLQIPFSLAWAGFAVFWNVSVWSMNAGWEFRLFGLPFLLVGIYITVGRFAHDAIVRRYTSYAVTNRRLLVIRNWPVFGTVVHSFDLQHLPSLELKERRGNRGSIVFQEQTIFEWTGSFNGMPAVLGKARFEDIENPRQVYELIQRQQMQLAS